MLELVASLVVDLSDQRLTVYNSNQEVVRVIPVSTGKASTPTPIFDSKIYTKYRSTTMHRRTYTVPDVPFTMCERGHLHARRPQAGERRATLRRAPQPWLCTHADKPRPLVVPQHPEGHTHHDSDLSQPTGRSPGCPCTGSAGGGSSGPKGPCSGRGSPSCASQASNQFTAVARRVRRGYNSPIR